MKKLLTDHKRMVLLLTVLINYILSFQSNSLELSAISLLLSLGILVYFKKSIAQWFTSSRRMENHLSLFILLLISASFSKFADKIGSQIFITDTTSGGFIISKIFIFLIILVPVVLYYRRKLNLQKNTPLPQSTN